MTRQNGRAPRLRRCICDVRSWRVMPPDYNADSRGTLRRDPTNPRAAMRRVIELAVVFVALARAGGRRRGADSASAVARSLRSPSAPRRPSSSRCSRSARCRSSVRRPVVFLVDARAPRRDDGAGSPISSSSSSRLMVKGFITAAFAPKPTAVCGRGGEIEQWPPQLTAIGTLRAYQGIFIAPQVGRRSSRRSISNRARTSKAGDLLINIDDSVEQADLANGLAQLQERRSDARAPEDAGARAATRPNRPSTRRSRRATAPPRPSSARAAIIAQKAIRAPFAGRHRPAQRRPRPVRRGRDGARHACSSSIRSTPTFRCPKRRWRRSPSARR